MERKANLSKSKSKFMGNNGFNMSTLNDKVHGRTKSDVDIFLSNNESPQNGKMNTTIDDKDVFELQSHFEAD